jgi:hypothetical protein
MNHAELQISAMRILIGVRNAPATGRALQGLIMQIIYLDYFLSDF